jgi:cytochrome c oxidase subunit 4
VLEIPVALGIAIAKSALVVMFFMALKYDKPVNSMVFTVGTVFVVVFLVFTLFDTAFRGDIGNVSTQTIQEEEAELERLREREPDPEQLRVTPSDYGQQGTGTGQGDGTN